MRIIKKYPFVTYAVFCVVSRYAIGLLARAGDGYEAGIGGVAFLLSILWSILALPFFVPIETLSSLNGGRGVPGAGFIGLAIGIAVCVLAEAAIQEWRRTRNRAE